MTKKQSTYTRPTWLTLQVMLYRSLYTITFRKRSAQFLETHPEVSALPYKEQKYILEGRVIR
jgi:hypothetical protein